MYTIISPSKTQDFEREVVLPSGVAGLFELAGVPEWNEQTKLLAGVMKKFKAKELSELMKISTKLAELNFERFQEWDGNYDQNKNVYAPAIVAFLGDVYRGFDLNVWSITGYKYAHNHLGIISGFYGLISPLNYIQPYRLEMGTRLRFSVMKDKGANDELKAYKNLYAFWSEMLTKKMATILKKEKVLINLASVEYSKVIDRKKLEELMATPKAGQRVDKVQIIDVIFKVNKVSKKWRNAFL